MDNQTDVSIKFKNSVTGQKKLDTYVETLTKIKSVLGSIDKGAASEIESSAKSTKIIDSDMKQMSKNFNTAFNYTALRTFARGLEKVVEGFTRMTSKSTAFLEDFNLFQVAFRGNYTEATKFVNKLSEMYGLDEDWLIKTTSQFKQLSNAMGLANETGEKVSKLMTELAIDISSLYNIDVDRASSVLQSALAGQTKPIRSLGADITQASLQQTLDKLDISQQVSQLSYAEKRLLIMVSLTQQLSSVTNDWGRTLESPSNQIRIMNEQWQRLQRNVGNIFLGIVSKVLPYLNAVLMVLNEIAKVIAGLFGYKLDDFDYFDESVVGGVEDFGDALDTAADSAKKLKQSLRGFDKLNVITTPSDTGTSGGGAGGVGGINSKLMDAFNNAFDEYQKKLENVEMKATKIRDKIMEWLGFTKVIDEETGEVSFKFDHITGGTILGALAVGGTIYKGISTIYKWLKRLGLIDFKGISNLGKIFTSGKATAGVTKLTSAFEGLAGALGISGGLLAGIIAGIVAIAAGLVVLYNKSDKFKGKVDEMIKSIETLGKTIATNLKPILDIFKNLFAEALKQGWENTKTVLGMMADGFEASFSTIVDVIGGTAQIITDIINLDFGKAFEDLKDMVRKVKDNWDTYWEKIGNRFDKWKEDLLKKIDEYIEDAKKKLEKLPQWFEELPEKLGKKIGRAIKTIKDKIDEVNWEELGKKIGDGIYNGFVKELPKLSLELNTLPIKLLAKVGELWWQWMNIGAQILAGIVAGMAGFIKNGGLGDVVNSFVKGLKKGLGINSPARVIIDAKIGDYSMEGILVGMERQLPKLQEEAKNIVDTLNSGIKEASIDTNFNYNIPQFDASSILLNTQGLSNASTNQTKQSVNPVIIVQVGDKELTRKVITDLQDMATNNGKPITIGG